MDGLLGKVRPPRFDLYIHELLILLSAPLSGSAGCHETAIYHRTTMITVSIDVDSEDGNFN